MLPTLRPLELTCTVKVKINVDGLNNVRKATCRLSGVPVSVFLATGHSSSERVTQEFPVGNPVFNEDDYPKGSLTGQFNVFGFSKTEEHNVETVFLLVDEKPKFLNRWFMFILPNQPTKLARL